MADLDVRLDAPLPAELAIGRGTALFVGGTCFAPGARIASLALDVDGDEQPVMAHGMPRLETLRALGDAGELRERVLGHRPHPGLRPRGGTRCGCARGFEGGGEAVAELATIPLAPPAEPRRRRQRDASRSA